MSRPPPFGRCLEHGLACGPEGQCVLCRRRPARGPTRARGTLARLVALLMVLPLVGSLAIRGLRPLARGLGAHGARRAASAPAGAPSQHVRLYTTPWCPYCTQAKQWLDGQRIEYAELDVTENDWARAEHRRLNPRGSVPTLDADGEVVIGFDPGSFQKALGRGRAGAGR